MPLSMDLSTTQQYASDQNRDEVLAITTTPDTVTITVNSNYPRVLSLRATTDCHVRKTPSAAGYPIASGAALNIQIASTTTFTVSADSSGGNLHILVLR